MAREGFKRKMSESQFALSEWQNYTPERNETVYVYEDGDATNIVNEYHGDGSTLLPDITPRATGGGDVESVNGETGVVVLDTSDVDATTDRNYVTDTEKTVVGNTSGTNTGDQTAATTPFTPASGLSSTNAQDAIEEVQSNVDGVTGLNITSITGWAEYRGTEYIFDFDADTGNKLSVAANTPVLIPNNSGVVRDSEKPTDITAFYDGVNNKILGIDGDAYLITLEATIVPTSGSTTYVESWIDVGGSIQPLYTRLNTFPKGQGVERKIAFSTGVFTLDTWQLNGGLPYIESNGTFDICNVRLVVYRLHKSGNQYVSDNSITVDHLKSLRGEFIKTKSDWEAITVDTGDRVIPEDITAYVKDNTTDAVLYSVMGDGSTDVFSIRPRNFYQPKKVDSITTPVVMDLPRIQEANITSNGTIDFAASGHYDGEVITTLGFNIDSGVTYEFGTGWPTELTTELSFTADAYNYFILAWDGEQLVNWGMKVSAKKSAPDVTAPTLSNIATSSISSDSATLTAQSNEAGNIIWAVYTSAAARNAADYSTVAAGTGSVDFGSIATVGGVDETDSITGLTSETTYDIRVFAEDEATPTTNKSTASDLSVTTTAASSFLPSDLSSTQLYDATDRAYNGVDENTSLGTSYNSLLLSGTYEFWFVADMADMNPSDVQILFSAEQNTTNRFNIQLMTDGNIFIHSGNTVKYEFNDVNLPDGAGERVFRMTSNEGMLSLYIDGVLQTISTQSTLSGTTWVSWNLIEGSRNNQGSFSLYYEGSIREKTITNSVLSGTDLTNMNTYYGV